MKALKFDQNYPNRYVRFKAFKGRNKIMVSLCRL
jgi:hypothetical protein